MDIYLITGWKTVKCYDRKPINCYFAITIEHFHNKWWCGYFVSQIQMIQVFACFLKYIFCLPEFRWRIPRTPKSFEGFSFLEMSPEKCKVNIFLSPTPTYIILYCNVPFRFEFLLPTFGFALKLFLWLRNYWFSILIISFAFGKMKTFVS